MEFFFTVIVIYLYTLHIDVKFLTYDSYSNGCTLTQSYSCRRSLDGSSIFAWILLRKVTASLPSTKRWSYVRARYIIGRATTWPSITTALRRRIYVYIELNVNYCLTLLTTGINNNSRSETWKNYSEKVYKKCRLETNYEKLMMEMRGRILPHFGSMHA